MNHAKVFINSLRLNTFVVSDQPFLKIYFDISKPDLSLSWGEFDYTDDQGQAIKLPIISIDTGILLVQLKPNIPYQGKLNLNFTTGENIKQDLGFALMPWLDEFKIELTPIISLMKFKGTLTLKVNPNEINQVKEFEINSPLLSSTQTLTSTNTNAYFKIMPPKAEDTLIINRKDMDGSSYQAGFTLCIPNLIPEPETFNQPGLGYGKYLDATSLQEIYNLPTIRNILPQQSTWQTHNPETASLANTQPLAVKSVISTDASQYINQHDVSQHSNYLDYSDAKSQGFAAGPSTKVTWNKFHQGNQTLIHQGNMSQIRQVQTETTRITAPEINYQYGTRTSTYTGNTMMHNTKNANIITNNEQSTFNTLEQNTQSYQQSINQSTEQYNTQTLNVDNYSCLAQNLTHSGPMFIDSESFDITEGSPILNALQQSQNLANQILNQNQDNDYNLFIATVYGESADTEAAWEAVADSIILRARHYATTPGRAVSAAWQYDAYINPSVLKFHASPILLEKHGQFLKAYAQLTNQKVNGQAPMNEGERKKLNKMYDQLKSIYNQYQDKSPLKYTITNYYSPRGAEN